MRKVLHLLSRVGDDWPAQLIEQQLKVPDTQHEVIDLRQEHADHAVAVKKIFEADSVQVW